MDSILNKMDIEQIFKLKRMEDGKIRVREECDRYYFVMLSAEELEALGRELVEYAKGERNR